ncbi:MAG: hypothetical protein Q8K36_02225 [Alphaproteobacteria bacterium]|nr:hypothetical protein [Alphaproteobacteria bacterium]
MKLVYLSLSFILFSSLATHGAMPNRAPAAASASGSVAAHHRLEVLMHQYVGGLRALESELKPITQEFSAFLKTAANDNVHHYDAFVQKHVSTIAALAQRHLNFISIPTSKPETESLLLSNMPDNVHDSLGLYIHQAMQTASKQDDVVQVFAIQCSLIEFLSILGAMNPKISEITDTLKNSFYSSIAENYTTNGGCFEGVRNRAFIQLLTTVNFLASKITIHTMYNSLEGY